MSEWNRFDFGALRDPRLKMFRAGSRWKILQLVEISLRDSQSLGLIALFDDEIASDLGLSLDSWLDLLDRLILRRVVRQLPTEDRTNAYEIAFWLLPKQTSASGVLRDARREDAWDMNPVAVVSNEEETPARRRGTGRAMTGAERTALSRARAEARGLKQPQPNAEAFLAQYRANIAAESASSSPPAPHDTATLNTEQSVIASPVFVTKIGNEIPNVTAEIGNGNGNALALERADRTEQNESERDNNSSFLGGNGNEIESAVTVTEGQNVTDLEAERNAVVAFLADAGLTIGDEQVRIARPVAVALAASHAAEAIYHQAEYLPYRRKTTGEWAGLLRTSIEGDYGAPGAWHKHQKAQAEKARQEQARQENKHIAQRREASGAEERGRLDAVFQSLSFDEQMALRQQAEGRLAPLFRDRLLKAREAGKPDTPLHALEIETHLYAILREQAERSVEAL